MAKVKIQVRAAVKFLHHNATGQQVYLQKEAFNAQIAPQEIEIEIPEDILTAFRSMFGSNTLVVELSGDRQILQGEALDSTPKNPEKNNEAHGPEFYSEIGSKGSQRVRKLIQAGKEHEEQ